MRLSALRRSRLLAGLVLLASPGTLGAILPVLHPCPVDAPWLVRQADAGAHQHHHGTAPADSKDHRCTCIGNCIGTAVPARAGDPVVARFAEEPWGPTWFPQDASLRLAPLASLLPPATAPPVA
jgi:hypothetical protein